MLEGKENKRNVWIKLDHNLAHNETWFKTQSEKFLNHGSIRFGIAKMHTFV